MRLGGIILYVLFLPLAPLAYLLLPMMILWNPVRAKESMRAIDQFCNAFYLNGSGRESVSSHAWRDYSDRKVLWAVFVVWLTDLLQKGHCKQANAFEQPVQEFIANG